jgi:AraC-like DNA-binding protein
MTETCVALGVSQRLLRSLCVQHLGMSPTAYDRHRRMSLARRALRHGNLAAVSVSKVGAALWLPPAWPFAVNYRAAFAELPSATLRRRNIQ